MASGAKPPRGDARRQLILHSTMRVIADEGLDAVTHRRVAQEAGISFGSITYWFESRQELINAAFRSYIDDASTFLHDLQATRAGHTVEDLVEYLVEVSRQEFRDPRMVLAEYELIVAAARDRELANAFVDWERTLLARLAEVFESAGAARPFESARTVLQLFRGAELDRLTRPEANEDDLRRRLMSVVPALFAPADTPAPASRSTDPTVNANHRGGSRAHHAPAGRRRS